MKKLNHWEQILGQKIDSIDNNHTLRIYLNDSESVLQLETSSEAVVSIIDPHADPQTYVDIDPERLYGLVVKKVVVPFLDEDYQGDPTIIMGFDRGPDVLLVPEDLSSRIRIT